MRAWVLCFSMLVCGCFMQNRATIERVGDAVQGLNDETRWGKTTLAADRVDPDFREQFLVNHEGWGRRIQIAECDLVSLRLGSNDETATSILNVSWYRLDTMEVAETTLRQEWRQTGATFILTREEVVGGDSALFTEFSTNAGSQAEAATPATTHGG